jgi:endonuclease/exonuclease/phosphatase family metal-dependent hydrolase
MTYNVWWKNRRYSDLANMIQDTVKADIVSLQEAVSESAVGDGQGSMAQRIVDALNAKGSGRWDVANPWGSSHYWCGLQIYRSDKFDLEWHREIGHTQHHPGGRADARGICGALLKRKSDSVKACVWGTHPVPTGTARDANELISVGTSAMKECSNMGAPSVFMCDCNDWNENQGGKGDSVRNHLRSQTGLDYVYAHSHGIDHIFVESSLGKPQGGTTIAPAQAGGGQPKSQWAGSDHAPVYVDIAPR